MTQAISKTIRISAVAATLLIGAFDARAQGAYTGDSGHYLQMPQGSQQAYQQQSMNARTSFNGQGMGQGQLQQGQMQQGFVQPMAPLTVTSSPASSSMLPQGYAPAPQAMPGSLPMAAMPMAAQPMAQPVRIQAAMGIPTVQPSVQALAAMEPAAGSSFDSGTNVQLTGDCGSPSNHRQHKGINTSTTVGNNCFN